MMGLECQCRLWAKYRGAWAACMEVGVASSLMCDADGEGTMGSVCSALQLLNGGC